MTALARNLLWLFGVAQLAVSPGSELAPTTRFSGMLKVFEYGAFQSDDGKFYSYKLVTSDAREPYFKLFRSHPRTEIMCLTVEFDGYRSGRLDSDRTEIVEIVRFHRIEKTKCT